MAVSVATWLSRLSRDSLEADGLLDQPLVSMSFREFSEDAWSHIDAAPLRWSWHLDEICDTLEDAARRRQQGEASSIAVAAPPGATKSRPVSVLWQPWVWTWWPGSEWITVSWDESLAYEFSAMSQDLVRSPWYQARWPMKVRGGSSRWSNDRGGRRVAGGIHSRFTGDHAHFIVGDDLLKEQLARCGSPASIIDAVQTAGSTWYGTLGTRAIDHIGCRVLAAQLLHRDDPVTVAIRDRGYERLVFPATFEAAHPYRSEHDRRTVEGEPLCDRISGEVIESVILDIGPSAAAAQLWQRPEPPGGQLLRPEYMTRRWRTLPQDIRTTTETGRVGYDQIWGIFADLAAKSKRQSRRRKGPDYTVIQVWCACGRDVYLIDQVRGQWGYREARAQLAALAVRYPWVQEIRLEDAANAPALEDDLEGGIHPDDLAGGEPPPGWAPEIILEPHGGGCLARVQATTGIWHLGRVVLPLGPRWVDEPGGFVDEHLRYSGVEGETDDQVAASSLALMRYKIRSSGYEAGLATAMNRLRKDGRI